MLLEAYFGIKFLIKRRFGCYAKIINFIVIKEIALCSMPIGSLALPSTADKCKWFGNPITDKRPLRIMEPRILYQTASGGKSNDDFDLLYKSRLQQAMWR